MSITRAINDRALEAGKSSAFLSAFLAARQNDEELRFGDVLSRAQINALTAYDATLAITPQQTELQSALAEVGALSDQRPLFGSNSNLIARTEAAFVAIPGAATLLSYDGAVYASRIQVSGATPNNQNWINGVPGSVLEVKGQNIAYDIIAGAVVNNNAVQLDTGLRALEWTFSDPIAGVDGDWPQERGLDPDVDNNGTFLAKALFMFAAARSLLLLRETTGPLITPLVQSRVIDLISRLRRSAVRMIGSSDITTYYAVTTRPTNQAIFPAVTIAIAGILYGDLTLKAQGDAYLPALLARQYPDGTLAEVRSGGKPGFDVNYQSVSCELLSVRIGCEPNLLSRPDLRGPLRAAVGRWLSQVAPDGTFLQNPGSRTIVTGTTPGTGPKGANIDQYARRIYLWGLVLGENYDAIAQAVQTKGQALDHR